MIFVITKTAPWGINVDILVTKNNWTLQLTFFALIGILCLSFFIHNIIITIMQNNRNQNKNVSTPKLFVPVISLLR